MELFLSIICLISCLAYVYLGFHTWRQEFEFAKLISTILTIDGFIALGNSITYFSNFVK